MEAAGLVNCAPTAKTAGTREKKIQESKDDFLACKCVGLAAMPRVYTFSFNGQLTNEGDSMAGAGTGGVSGFGGRGRGGKGNHLPNYFKNNGQMA